MSSSLKLLFLVAGFNFGNCEACDSSTASFCVAAAGKICTACRDCNPHLEGTGPFMLQANLSQQGFYQLCSTDCRISFLRKWIQAHLQECTRIGAIRAHLLMMFLP